MAKKPKPVDTPEPYTPNDEECRFVIFKTIYQAIADYMNLTDSKSEEDQFSYETAKDFLFDDDYWVQWGDIEIKSTDLMAIADLDPDWVRSKVLEKAHPVIGNDGVIAARGT